MFYLSGEVGNGFTRGSAGMTRRKHFIITLGRSGSNTLVDGLNQNKEILNFGEVLGEWTTTRKIQRFAGLYKNEDDRYLDELLSNRFIQRSANGVRSILKIKNRKSEDVKDFRNVRTVGIKEFSMNLHRFGIFDYLSDRPDIAVIALLRRNPIDRMVSWLRLERTGLVSRSSRDEGKGSNRKLRIDIADFMARLEVVHNENVQLERLIKKLPSERLLTINYEEFFASPEKTAETFRVAQEFLDVTPVKINTRMKKIIDGDPVELFENSGEIKKELAKGKFSKFLR
jgi:hypothetical protein